MLDVGGKTEISETLAFAVNPNWSQGSWMSCQYSATKLWLRISITQLAATWYVPDWVASGCHVLLKHSVPHSRPHSIPSVQCIHRVLCWWLSGGHSLETKLEYHHVMCVDHDSSVSLTWCAGGIILMLSVYFTVWQEVMDSVSYTRGSCKMMFSISYLVCSIYKLLGMFSNNIPCLQ